MKFNRVLFGPKAAHYFLSDSGLFEDGYTVLFTKICGVVKKLNTMVGVSKHTGGMCLFELKLDSKHALAPAKDENDMLDV